MLKKMIDQQLIDIEGMVLYNYKLLNLDEVKTMIILLTLRLEKKNHCYITPKLLSEYMSIDEKVIDRCVITLINQQLLSLEGNTISSKPLLDALLKLNKFPEVSTDKLNKVNLVQCFEKEFSRGLTPIEIEILKEWKQCQYSDEMILDALKEATLSNVRNMRYIEKILIDWAKYGKKVSGRNTVDSQQKSVDLVQYEWWNES